MPTIKLKSFSFATRHAVLALLYPRYLLIFLHGLEKEHQSMVRKVTTLLSSNMGTSLRFNYWVARIFNLLSLSMRCSPQLFVKTQMKIIAWKTTVCYDSRRQLGTHNIGSYYKLRQTWLQFTKGVTKRDLTVITIYVRYFRTGHYHHSPLNKRLLVFF